MLLMETLSLSHVALLNCSLLLLFQQAHKTLLSPDCKKSSSQDKIELFFLKIAADIIAEPIASVFNLSLASNGNQLWFFLY